MLAHDEPKYTITLQLENGTSLDKFVDVEKKSTILSIDCEVIWYQMCSALSFLHSRSVIHDDVKPDNIMFCPKRKHAVLIDLGAALINMPPDYFHPSGTPSFAPPEFLLKHKSAKGDVWGLGVTMCFLFGYIMMPDGNWILPEVFDESSSAREEMIQWLADIERIRKEREQDKVLLANMLVADTNGRISIVDLLNCLESNRCKTLI
jgi:serine/threonine protein kinase